MSFNAILVTSQESGQTDAITAVLTAKGGTLKECAQKVGINIPVAVKSIVDRYAVALRRNLLLTAEQLP
ncbi:unnamed protein product [Leptosia nina]|uniref:Uncharacterized protein n=1 Tax=Leptosia nina TaxID=320188 RepID=A0AAV1JLZ3_9NEOP